MQSMAENISPQIVQLLARELKKLASAPPDGIKYIPQHDSMTEIHAEIAGPEDTPYEGGKFHIKLVVGADFPQKPPRGFFLTKIFHPNVSKNGDICVNTLKRDWKANVGLKHILQVIRCLLIVPFPESSLNDEAGKLFMESYDEYVRRAKLYTEIHAKSAASAEASSSSSASSSASAKPAASGTAAVSSGTASAGKGKAKSGSGAETSSSSSSSEGAHDATGDSVVGTAAAAAAAGSKASKEGEGAKISIAKKLEGKAKSGSVAKKKKMAKKKKKSLKRL